jgi:glycine hydroxymethyltransferase
LTKGANAGKPSKVKYNIAEGVIDEAQQRVSALLNWFVLYPELDLEVLKKHFS